MTTDKNKNILNWLISEVDGQKYWIIDGGIYKDGDLETDIYDWIPLDLKEKILNNAKSNIL